jgi:ABC-2 type transport system permease protein
MTTLATPAPAAAPRSPALAATALASFGALLARDLTVLRKQPGEFITRTVIQPVLFVFVLGYINPRIGQSTAGSATQAATTLLAGMLAIVILFQGLFAVALPLVQDFGYTREIEDRLLAPLSVRAVALEKIALGTIQGLLAAVVIFPLAILIPAASPAVHVHWAVLVTLAPLAALMCASLGLFLGTAIDPRLAMALFAVLITPLMWLGCAFFPWSALHVIPWVQGLALADPLTYASEGLRAAVTSQPHLSLLVVYPVLVAATGLLLWQATRHFTRRVIS